MAWFYKRSEAEAAPKTVADVLSGFNQIVDDLKAVREENVSREAEAWETIKQAESALEKARNEANAATKAIDNITTLVGG
jgi:chromosome segregation ATPase